MKMLRRLWPAAAPLRPRAHRSILKRDVERMRWAGTGDFVMPRDNPGVRVEPDFVTEVEGEAIAAELEAVAKAYGYPYDGESRVHLVSTGGEVETTLDGVVNNLRVTGRLERPDLGQGLPPWGYGDGFDATQLPPAIGELAQRIASCGAFALGPVRDVTVNIRESSFFQARVRMCMHAHMWRVESAFVQLRTCACTHATTCAHVHAPIAMPLLCLQLDLHLDPAADGPDVFILGLGSSAVLTFTPPDAVLASMGEPPRRRSPSQTPNSSLTRTLARTLARALTRTVARTVARTLARTLSLSLSLGVTRGRSGCAAGRRATWTSSSSPDRSCTSRPTRGARGCTPSARGCRSMACRAMTAVWPRATGGGCRTIWCEGAPADSRSCWPLGSRQRPCRISCRTGSERERRIRAPLSIIDV